MIVVVCPTCGKRLEIDPKYAGQSGRCNGCGGLVYAVEPKTVTMVPKPQREPLARRTKASLILLLFAVFPFIWFLNDSVHIDVSKPIGANHSPSAVAAQLPPMPDALLEEIKHTVLLDFERSDSLHLPLEDSVRQAQIAEYAQKASPIPLDDYKESLEGQRVSWNGIVWESRKNLLWGYEVVVDIPGNNVMELILDVTRDEAHSLTQGQSVAFVATISSISNSMNLIWIHLDDARILGPDDAVPFYESPATRSLPPSPVPGVEVEPERVLPSRKTYESIQSELMDEPDSRSGRKRNLTSAQKYTLAQSLIGTRIAWHGWVEDVVPQRPGEFYLLLMDMDPPTDRSSIGDVLFEVPEKDADKFATGQPIYVEGTIAIVEYESGNCSIGLIDAEYQTK